jgi:hypothetical protein
MADNNETASREQRQNEAAKLEQSLQRTNQILGGVVAFVVLGVGGAYLYQNGSGSLLPDVMAKRDSAWSSFWKKELSKDPSERLGIEMKAPEWEKDMKMPTMDEKGQFHWDQSSSPNGND